MSAPRHCPNLAADFARISPKAPSVSSFVYLYIVNPGFRAITLYRLARRLRAWRRLAGMISSHSVSSTGCDISPAAEIGPGLLLPHPVGVVIGCGARIGERCTILQNVTIGERYSSADDHSYPSIQDKVTICAGAVLLGKVVVARGATVAANAVVVHDVPEGMVAAGVPAAIKPRRHETAAAGVNS